MGMCMHGLGMGCNVPTHTNPWGFCGVSHRLTWVGGWANGVGGVGGAQSWRESLDYKVGKPES